MAHIPGHIESEIAPVTNPVGNGLVNNSPPVTTPTIQPIPAVSTYTPATATSTGYTPTPYVVPQSGLVQERVKNIVADDSPLMQQARMLASQTMNERGLVNSSLATTAGQQAVIAAALPIAQADAAAYNAAMTNTANVQNAASQFDASAQNTVALANQAAQNVAFGANISAENTRALALLDTNTKTNLATLDNQYRQLLQTNQDAANMFNQMLTNIANISQNSSLTPEAKDAAVSTQLSLLNEGLQQQQAVATAEATALRSLNLSQFFRSDVVSGSPVEPVSQLQSRSGNGWLDELNDLMNGT